MPIGVFRPASNPQKLAVEARDLSSRMPELLLSARHIAATIMMGRHARRKQGVGENFWQFRPYSIGEPVSTIDWRHSARDYNTYIRDREWETSQTIWLSPDDSASMQFQSQYAQRSKIDQAFLLSLALADIFSRNGERIAIPNILEPITARNGAERAAFALLHYQEKKRSENQKARDLTKDFLSIRPHSQLFLVSDFLDEPDTIIKKLHPLVQKKISLHLIEIADPAEETFPYHGRVEFTDPNHQSIYIAGRAETLREDYRTLYFARRESLKEEATKRGWTYTISRTDEPLTKTILHLSDLLNASNTPESRMV